MSLKVAIVTGASAGIGRATAIALSLAGWNVVLTGRRIEQLQKTEKSCIICTTLVVAGELTDEAFVARLFKETIDHFGRLDLLFNNAGITAPRTPIESLSLQAFQDMMTVNVTAPFLCIREAFRVFKAQIPQGGRIINNGSIAAHTPRPQALPYACSKHAMTGLTKSAALDGRDFGITCTQVDIGNAQTSMVAQTNEGALQPDGRILSEATFDAKHVAESIVYIASLPSNVTVLDYKIMAAAAPFVGRG